jgi:DNA-binding NarL/FixJ family response regulator
MNVLICNDRAEPLDSLVNMLENNRDVTSVKVATTGRQTLDVLHSSPIDISISSGTGLDFNRMLQSHIAPTVTKSLIRIVATQSPTVPLLVKAHQFGFHNVLPLTTPEDEIVLSLQRTLNGEESIKDHPSVKLLHLTAGALTHAITYEDLDHQHIVELVGVGLSDHEIAEALSLSIQNVRNRIEHIIRTNSLTNRTQLALLQNANWQIPDFT